MTSPARKCRERKARKQTKLQKNAAAFNRQCQWETQIVTHVPPNAKTVK